MFDCLSWRLSRTTLARLGVVAAVSNCGGEVADGSAASTGGSVAGRTDTAVATASYTVIVTTSGGASVALGGSGAVGNVGGYALGGAVAVTGGAIGIGGASAAGGTGIDCTLVDCSAQQCPAGYESVTLAGSCCPTCVLQASACNSVTCLVPNCPSGYTVGREPGACCDTCSASATATPPNCEAVDCGTPVSCALGYVVTNTPWTCCPSCAPDPNYCETDADCVVATRYGQCCTCPTSISTRRYTEDSCYYAASSPRLLPTACGSQVACAVTCGACTTADAAKCLNHTCTSIDNHFN